MTMPKAEIMIICPKNEQLTEKQSFEGNCFEDNLSAKGLIIQ